MSLEASDYVNFPSYVFGEDLEVDDDMRQEVMDTLDGFDGGFYDGDNLNLKTGFSGGHVTFHLGGITFPVGEIGSWEEGWSQFMDQLVFFLSAQE